MSEPVQSGKPIPQGQPEKAPKKKPLDVSQKLPDLTPPGTSMPPVQFSDLPDEVIELILSLLGIKDSAAVGRASTQLYNLSDAYFSSMRHLDLSEWKGLTPESLGALLRRFPNLTSLCLPKHATDDFLKVLTELPLHENLTSLDCNKCQQLTDKGFRKLALCTNLQKLDLSWTMIGLALIAICKSCPKLMDLNCNHCSSLRGASLQAIARCSKLQKVHLQGADLTDALLISICKNNPDLMDLDCQTLGMLSDIALQSIAGLSKLQKLSGRFEAASLKSICENCKNLVELNCGNSRTCSSAELQVITHCKKLQRLSLMQTAIDDACLESICQSCPELEYLNCACCDELTSQGLLHSIVSLEKLRSLDFTSSAPLDEATVARICKACPELVEFRYGMFKTFKILNASEIQKIRTQDL